MQPVGADAVMAVADRARERRQSVARVRGRDAQEVVAVGVRLHDANGRHHGIGNALKT